jgi:FMN phosphatase YigB (HAD superfamily)
MMMDVLSQKVVDRMGLHESQREHLRQMFVALRADAGGELHAVYTSIAKFFPLPCSVEEMVLLEMQTEQEMLVPINATLQLIKKLRAKGDGSILYISDMYLPSFFIQERLTAFGFFHEGDRLYVSDEIGAWKRDGSLFRYIHEQEKISYYNWHHYGDSRQNDYYVPRRLGIHAHRLHYDFLPYEREWMDMPVTQYQYPSLMAGLSRAIRLRSNYPSDQLAFIADLSAPVMVSWTIRVLQDATHRNLRKLYFFARDTHAEYLIARSLTEHFPTLEIHYLFVSGSSLYNDSPLRIKYLEQEGVADLKGGVAIVDSGSTGRGQQEINKLLTKHGYPPVVGYLLWFGNAYISSTTPNTFITAEVEEFYSDYMAHKTIHKITGVRKFIELIFPLNFHSRTVDYTFQKGGSIGPVFDSSQNGDDITINNFRRFKQQSDKLLVEYAEAFFLNQLQSSTFDVLHKLAIPTFGRFALNPRKEYTQYLHRFKIKQQPYVNQLTLNNLTKHNYGWFNGSLAYTLPGPIGRIVFHWIGGPWPRRIKKFFRLISHKQG